MKIILFTFYTIPILEKAGAMGVRDVAPINTPNKSDSTIVIACAFEGSPLFRIFENTHERLTEICM
jgi:hypothetical protein